MDLPELKTISHDFFIFDTCVLLQLHEIRVKCIDVGVSTKIETGSIRVISSSDPPFAPFSDMSMGHKIFLHGQISALLQLDEISVSYSSVGAISRIQIGQTRVFSISDPHFAPFSDMSMGHKIFLYGQISALLQIYKVSD